MVNLTTDELEKRLTRALQMAGGMYSVQDIKAAVDAGKMQSWQNNGSVVLTEILEAPQGKYLNIFLACGNLNDVMFLQDHIADFAREHGCSKLVMKGRKGWKKVLPDFGWRDPYVTFEYPLEDI